MHAAAHRAIAEADSMPVAAYILGKTHKRLIEKLGFVLKLIGLGWASEDSVSYYFDMAITLSHDNMIQCRYEYGDFLYRTDGDKESAVKMLKRALDLPLRDEQDESAQVMARQLLIEIEGD